MKHKYTKLIFNASFIVIIVIFFIFWASTNYKVHYVYFECPIDSVLGCSNPLVCEPSLPFATCQDSSICQKFPEYCEDYIIPAGSSFGEKPPSWVNELIIVMISTLGTAFFVNYLLYKRLQKKKM